MAYCTAADLYGYGLPRGSVPNPGRLVYSVDASADTLELDVHGLVDDDEIQFRAEAGGSLPAPLVAGTTYYAIATSESLFQVAASAGGGAIDLTTVGENVVLIVPLPITTSIAWGASFIDDMLPAHLVPLESPYPTVIVAANAQLAIAKLMAGKASSESLSQQTETIMKQVQRWAKGVPIRGTNAPTRERASNVAVSASVPYADQRGWGTHGRL